VGTICAERKGNKVYYVYRESYREKIDPRGTGKVRGSGKSRVRTRAVYLGSAEKILEVFREKREPVSVKLRRFGLVAAAYQTAAEIGLQDILMKHMPGRRANIPHWVYFFTCIINRLDNATSKNKMSAWLKKTILPELLGIDPAGLSGKNYWYAADYQLSESELREKRESAPPSDDPFAGVDVDTFTRIEKDLFYNVDELMGLSPSVICYDTTNFYSYIDEPVHSELANTCYSKDSKHHLKHVGLLMAVERNYGVPLLSQVYRANCHDTKVFSCILADLILALKDLCGEESDLVVVLDKGNNSEDNFKSMTGVISWIGSLVPSHHKDLIDLDISAYHGDHKELRYYRCTKTLMGVDCAVVLVFNAATKRKQEHTLRRGIEKLKKQMSIKWASYKKAQTSVPRGLITMQDNSRYGKCVIPSLREGRLHIEDNDDEIRERKKRFGKSLIFSNMADAETGFLIDTYHQKWVIEDDFRVLKDESIIRFRPIRHWTDTKIRAYAFCCIIALTLMRVMQWKAQRAGYTMSPQLLKDELSDIQEVLIVYDPTEATRKITYCSTVQMKLWEEFKLDDVKRKLLLH
jgi:transposase